MRLVWSFLLVMGLSFPAYASFDQSHAAWTQLLRKHVTWIRDGHASVVDYAGFKRDQPALEAYLATLSAVPKATFERWTRDQQLAFLINAYNAFTVDLILRHYPGIKSIKDIGSWFSSPWSIRFFTLLDGKRTLDDVEHKLIRPVYRDPRVHMALNCASKGCPALRPEAYEADRLDAQLNDSVRRFLGDRPRNRYNASAGELQVSKIFDWYGDDWQNNAVGFHGIKDLFARYAEVLAQKPAAIQRIRQQEVPVEFLDYDWSLNGK
ncbi:DUF547 domain-containing protein [Mangrovitalea sediminis]|uniref:DUF547 domain-containing protein n=1 Tax=Mangrovitalea sediminis TaxID=1982043 RepID=UPI000BE57EC3|nr:DUF547 domain-containing protein [Mangrovitalea sediminis]